VDIRKVKKLIELVKTTGVAELEIKEGEESVRISLETHQQVSRIPVISNQYLPTTAQDQIKTDIPSTREEDIKGHTVKSPMVGTIYLAPSPGTPPFVKIGQKINKGDTLCIIEAMKMFNKVESDIDGIVSACLIENGQSIEFEQKLFIIEPEKH